MYKGAVVGAGFGGLAAAIRMQSLGISTTIYEKNADIGGRGFQIELGDYRFDAGPTVVTAPDTIHELFRLAGTTTAAELDMVPIDPFYRLIWQDGSQFDYCGNPDALEQQIAALNPADVRGYRAYLQYAEEVYRIGYEQLAHVPFQSFWDMVRISPDLIRLKGYRSIYQTISHYIKDPRLRQAFSFNSLLIGGNPFKVSSIYSLIHPLEKKFGVFYPRGGLGELSRKLGEVFVRMGGQIETSCPVDSIVTKGNRVEGVATQSGFKPANLVVSNSDVVHTYQTLLKNHSRGAKQGQSLKSKRHSMSLFLIYAGVRKTFPNLTQHNIIFASRYRQLLKEIFEGSQVPDDFSLYVHLPSYNFDGFAPDGHSSVYILSPVPHLANAPVDWPNYSADYAAKIIDYLDRGPMPGLKSNIVCHKTFCPEDFRDRFNTYQGSAFSLEPVLTQSAWFRVHNRDQKIGGLYFVGAGTHPGAGIPGVLGSAQATCQLIEEDYIQESSRKEWARHVPVTT